MIVVVVGDGESGEDEGSRRADPQLPPPYSEVAHVVYLDAAGEEENAEAGAGPQAQGNCQHQLR